MSDAAKPQSDQPTRRQRAFSGTFTRIAAFILDVLILWMLGWALNRAFHPLLLHLNPALPWLSFVFAYIYFLIGEGPLGGGRTTGKYVLRLHIVTADGGAPSWQAAFRRAAIKTLLVIALVFQVSDPQYNALIFPRSLIREASFAVFILLGLGFAFTLVMLISILVHPWKRGLHDIWAGTFVTADPTPGTFNDLQNQPLDMIFERRMKAIPKMVMVFGAILTAIIMLDVVRSQSRPAERERYDDAQLLQDQNPELKRLRLTKAVFPSEKDGRDFAALMSKRSPNSLETTDTLFRRDVFDGESIAIKAMASRDALTTQTARSTEMIRTADRLRAAAWQALLEKRSRDAQQPAARRFKLYLVEPLQFLIYNGSKWPAVIEGPADPTSGPLVARPFAIIVPARQPRHEPGPKPNATPAPRGS